MARLTNTPIQTLALDLERRKSYSFRCVVLNNERNPLDLSGCVVRFVMKDAEYDGDLYDMTNLIVNSEGEIASPESGEVSFSFQAAELDGPPGEYNYSIVMWTQDGFSIVLLKGVLNLHPNTESLSVTRTYTSGTTNAAIEVVLRGNDVIQVIANTVPQGVGGSNIVGTGRPDNPATLEAKSLALVASAPVGAVFVSLDGAGAGLWAWRKRTSGWFVIEGGPVAWTSLTGIPSAFNPSAHNHPVSDIAATGIRSATTFLSGSGVWTTPVAAWDGITGKPAAFTPEAHTHLTSHLTDTTVTGRALMKALDAGVARAAIGAGTSNLALGTTAGTAAEGNHTHSQYAPTSHQHLLTDVSGLQTALNAKANSSHNHDLAHINGLSAALAAKSAVGHGHVVTDITGLRAELDEKSAAGHTHDDRYFTETESDARFVRSVNGQGPDGSGNVTVSSGGGGVTDHGALDGLAHDDHPQYALADGTRGSFAAASHSHTAATLSSGAAADGFVLTADGAGGAAWEAPPAGGGGASPYLIVGPGRPDTPATTGGLITGSEPVGTEYRSTDGASAGAWVWMKRSSGWAVTDGDTGWRGNISTDAQLSVYLRRVGNLVSADLYMAQRATGFIEPLFILPSGFAPKTRGWAVSPNTSAQISRRHDVFGRFWVVRNDNQVRWELSAQVSTANQTGGAGLVWSTEEPWPTTLPGNPA